MDALQMKYEFEIGYELANLTSRGYTEKEISTLLTKAQNDVVLNTIDSENDESRDKVISQLKEDITANTRSSTVFPNARQVDLPTKTLKILHERVDITLNTTSSFYNVNDDHLVEDVPIISITEDYYNKNIDNPDKKPYHRLVWRLLSSSNVVLIGDSTFTPSSYKMLYIRRPSPIIIPWEDYTDADGEIDGENWADYTDSSLDCELDEIFHRKIVDRAVILAIEPTGNTQRLQNKVSLT